VEDDKVDACSGALEMLNPRTKSWGMFEVTRQKAEQPLAEQRPKPQPAQSLSAPGYMEWLAANTRAHRRRVYPLGVDNRKVPEPLLIEIDIASFAFGST
jgi:hypothetical protein